MPEFPSDKDTATKSDKTITIGLTLAGRPNSRRCCL